eukprot:NODE_20_length_39102_cov_0.325513.p5 type:complete len:676 gc:universal NODE_20_length_39102_cov_0.325513:20616-18589(-)
MPSELSRCYYCYLEMEFQSHNIIEKIQHVPTHRLFSTLRYVFYQHQESQYVSKVPLFYPRDYILVDKPLILAFLKCEKNDESAMVACCVRCLVRTTNGFWDYIQEMRSTITFYLHPLPISVSLTIRDILDISNIISAREFLNDTATPGYKIKKYQDIIEDHPNWFFKKPNVGEQCPSLYVFFISHRWEAPKIKPGVSVHPDPESRQLKVIRTVLQAIDDYSNKQYDKIHLHLRHQVERFFEDHAYHNNIKDGYTCMLSSIGIWYDYMCLPQRDEDGIDRRTPSQKVEFETLFQYFPSFINSASITLCLRQMNDDYRTRGWCHLESHAASPTWHVNSDILDKSYDSQVVDNYYKEFCKGDIQKFIDNGIQKNIEGNHKLRKLVHDPVYVYESDMKKMPNAYHYDISLLDFRSIIKYSLSHVSPFDYIDLFWLVTSTMKRLNMVCTNGPDELYCGLTICASGPFNVDDEGRAFNSLFTLAYETYLKRRELNKDDIGDFPIFRPDPIDNKDLLYKWIKREVNRFLYKKCRVSYGFEVLSTRWDLDYKIMEINKMLSDIEQLPTELELRMKSALQEIKNKPITDRNYELINDVRNDLRFGCAAVESVEFMAKLMEEYRFDEYIDSEEFVYDILYYLAPCCIHWIIVLIYETSLSACICIWTGFSVIGLTRMFINKQNSL